MQEAIQALREAEVMPHDQGEVEQRAPGTRSHDFRLPSPIDGTVKKIVDTVQRSRYYRINTLGGVI